VVELPSSQDLLLTQVAGRRDNLVIHDRSGGGSLPAAPFTT
jgi:hypothetical protein